MKCLLTALEHGEGLASDGSVLSGVQLACDALLASREDGELGVINEGQTACDLASERRLMKPVIVSSICLFHLFHLIISLSPRSFVVIQERFLISR